MKTLNDLTVEERKGYIGKDVYYTGDIMNQDCMCKIISFSNNRFGSFVTIEMGDEKLEETLMINGIAIEYAGPSGTLFIMADVYKAWEASKVERAKAEYEAAVKRIEEAKEETVVSEKAIPKRIFRLAYQDGKGGGPYYVKETSDKALEDWFQDPYNQIQG